ncbi:putative outer membrane starch-binding protein [Dysgonomonas alginatilytica]|uniref:Putative outer membrane starch-binding protein n=1 Tax=Dysgonomonas alginatilytica TaxID=1605892 RepID=A0A2V3PXK6_9BACT|nr:RagB/SusD family nutrient uptake outer membrane protein [Dysgonomonas alginatilytica]PXV65837.1 putative outer membrane starch-binding protein [Dysgonomonas alginatilytica]
MKKHIILLLLAITILSGCQDQFAPADDSHFTFENVYKDPTFAEGLLLNAYTALPNIYGFSFNDVATDDAVSNDKSNDYRRMATGQWSAQFNPMNQWDRSYTAIMYLNKLLVESDKINWAPISGEKVSQLYNSRHKGEAYGLRAYFMYCLLQAHGGYDAQGTLLGVPVITAFLENISDFKKPRDTYKDCLTQIYADLSEAEKYLPTDYSNISDASQMLPMYASLGVDVDSYNRVLGDYNKQRMTARIAKGIRAKVALMAASPAYGQESWENAAKYAGESLKLVGGISGLDPQGGLFFLGSNVDKLDILAGKDQGEILWRGSISKSRSLEQNNFPPTLYGNGRINPTQNLVDAFPMANGYPISDASKSGYDPTKPYDGRDPRLANYIIYNRSSFSNKVIYTENEGGNDAVDKISTSTRTGYYMRKLLRSDVNLNPSLLTDQNHYSVHIRYTELFLAYAEAANEAWGPDGKGTNSYSAREIIAAIRKRAGISQPDAYLASITGKDDMRKLIHNERRLELCFEGFRFWDLRRWKESISESANGVKIENNSYTVSAVENRTYSNFMYYAPIPYQEALKLDLVQNAGW